MSKRATFNLDNNQTVVIQSQAPLADLPSPMTAASTASYESSVVSVTSSHAHHSFEGDIPKDDDIPLSVPSAPFPHTIVLPTLSESGAQDFSAASSPPLQLHPLLTRINLQNLDGYSDAENDEPAVTPAIPSLSIRIHLGQNHKWVIMVSAGSTACVTIGDVVNTLVRAIFEPPTDAERDALLFAEGRAMRRRFEERNTTAFARREEKDTVVRRVDLFDGELVMELCVAPEEEGRMVLVVRRAQQ